jgi:two-component system, NarL family, response regulator DesR
VIRTIIAEPAALPLAGLVAVLTREPDIDLVATVRDAAEVLPAVRGLQPDVVLLSRFFPGPGELAQWIGVAAASIGAAPHCRCAILSPVWQSHEVGRATDAGVHGLLLADASPEYLIGAVRRIAAGRSVVDISLSRVVQSPLTGREADVLRAVAQGLTSAEIAAAYYLSEGTVRNYVSRAIAKTGARNRVGAISIAAESGWL